MSGLSWSMRRRLYQQASSQLENGLGLAQILEDFRERLARRGRERAAEAAHDVARKVRDGMTLMAAMGRGSAIWSAACWMRANVPGSCRRPCVWSLTCASRQPGCVRSCRPASLPQRCTC
uniref:Type II secretion system protein GspF domain-containing protein n=1 Tax=Cupriavidus taiwanensis TaxID=164546 RepID=A0A375H9B3_9BURK|nr:protein of unknown function [Cupriavidus taiwanensis]